MTETLTPVEEFAAFCRGRRPWRPVRGQSPTTLRNSLLALDGTLAGASRRAIAEVIFGRRPVSEDWNSGDDLYKKRTKRLVEKGVALMDSGYRTLL